MSDNILQVYDDLNFCTIPIKPYSKEPLQRGWPALGREEGRRLIQKHPGCNFGVVLGDASGGIVDVDFDNDLAAELGKHLLPETGFVFGRKSRPATHMFYRCPDAGGTNRFSHPDTGKVIVELRGNGGQTVLPGSVHPSGERVRFEEGRDGPPGLAEWRSLHSAVGQVAASVVLAERWQSGVRHEHALWFSGACASRDVDQNACAKVIQAVCAVCGDDDLQDRLTTVETTYDRSRKGLAVAGSGKLAELLGSRKAVEAVMTWMGARSALPMAIGSGAPDAVAAIMDLSTDMSAAEAFSGWVGDRLIYADGDDCFYRQRNGVFEPASIVTVKGLAMDFLREHTPTQGAAWDVSRLRAVQSQARINAVVDLSKPHLSRISSDFDSAPHLVGCRNGVLDLSTAELTDTSVIVTKRLGCAYLPEAECPTFLKFLQQVFAGDQEKIAYVQRAMAYTLTPSVAAQVFFILVGTGSNGKSVFLKVLQALMGSYGASMPVHTLTVQKFGNERTDDLAGLDGKRFVSASEGEAGARLAVAKIKRMTGGDVISVRPLYGKYFDLKPEFKLWFASNDLPQVAGNDEAIWRRIHVIDFPVTFGEGERDPKLYEKLTAELPGILNWALDGLRQMGEMKGDFLAPPISVIQAIRSYRGSNDSVGDFVAEACVRDGAAKSMMGNLYVAYERFCENSGSEALPKVVFGKELSRLGYDVVKTRNGNGRKGIRLMA